MVLRSIIHWGKTYIPAAIISSLFLQDDSSLYFSFFIFNLSWQTICFFCCAMVPAFVSGRMSYVDLAWPFGLVLISVLAFFTGSGFFWRKLIVSLEYLLMGGRMSLGAIMLLSMGHLNKELPRYIYQRYRWEKRNENHSIAIQLEIFVQALANICYLCMPALLLANDPTPSFYPLEFVGHAIWISGWVFESVADAQKLKFLKDCKTNKIRNAVCNVGLWRYSRHPNYFGEWMVWVGLAVSSISTLVMNPNDDEPIIQLTMGFSIIMTVYLMYWCLTFYTGAVPAEHFSMQKRPHYKIYQESTNMFFPAPSAPSVDTLNQDIEN